MKYKEVKLDEGQTTKVYKLPLVKYAELFKRLKSLPKHAPNLEEITMQSLLESLPELLENATPDIIGIIVLVTDLKKEDAEQIGATEAANIFEALFEVNNYDELIEKVKKAFAHQLKKRRKSLTSTNGSGE